jgi:putative peptide maturation dehydrogenase
MELIREEFGVPPDHFHATPGALEIHELPVITKDGPLYELLQRRRTTRSFDREKPTSLTELSIVLRYTFGCHALTPVYEGFTLVSKTSPSGGGLHPVEVYPLIARVDGIDPGLYHYNTSEHALELLEPLAPDQVELLIEEFTAGQTYLRSAHVLLVLTARFERSFWKYRQHEKAYPVVLMDAAHLSQTLYLVCTELGLGAFVTAAVNGANVDERLGIDGFHEGTIAAVGFGKPAEGHPMLDPSFTPFVPRS